MSVEISLCDVFEEFLSSIAGQSYSSQYNYRRRLEIFFDRVGHKQPENLTRADVNEWYAEILLFGFAEATLSGYKQAIKSFCKWLKLNGYHSI